MHLSPLIPFFILIIMTHSVIFSRNVGMEGDLYEGDIALRRSLPSNSSSTVKLAAIRDVSKVWPGGKVPFRIDTESIPNEDDQLLVLEAMETLSREVSCIEFLDNNHAQKFDSVRIAGDGDKYHSSSGCWSYVGMQGGEQTLNLGSGCFIEEVILHELLHLLGIIHEQNRPDRDDFVNIIWSNIESGKQGQFEKRNESAADMQDTPYDFRSRMHYTEDSFSKSDASTIVARFPGNDNFGPLDKLSPTDIVEISLLYRCSIDSRTVIKYTHANRYANEVRIEQIYDELDVLNSTIEDKTCEIDVKLKEMNEKLSSITDQNGKCSDLEMKVNETVIKANSCDVQIQLMKELFTTKNERIEGQLNELTDLFNTKNAEIEQLKENTNQMDVRITQLKEENKKLEEENNQQKKLNNQQKERISHLEEKMSKIADCKWSLWSAYSQCNITGCGSDGTKTRSRAIEQQSRGGGAECTGGTIQTIGCSDDSVAVLLHTDNEYSYYKVPVTPGCKLTTATVLETCRKKGMIPQCHESGRKSDSNCIVSPGTYPPAKIAEILCKTRDPKNCPSTVNMFWYIINWYGQSACGVTKKSWCVKGKGYTSTSSTQYFAACLKAL